MFFRGFFFFLEIIGMNLFQQQPIEKRTNLYKKIQNIHPNYIPIIVTYQTSLWKMLFHKEKTLGEFKYQLHERCFPTDTETIFLLTENNTIPVSSLTIEQVHEKHKNKDDQFLYLTITKENVFGSVLEYLEECLLTVQ